MKVPSSSFILKFLALFTILAVALGNPNPVPKPKPSKTTSVPVKPTHEPPKCIYGPFLCCESFELASSSLVVILLEILGIKLASTVEVGVTCVPISVFDVNFETCFASPLCCENNGYNGVVATGCTRADIGL
ncbi:hypothetical protein SCHPADRAFT_943520 [Schizopora paradoxa]|uniref:Hydrophobin n=1 Tax=Schizopora paradoxa TaxID=27342 RepID=A0A0H2RCR9_9AGAM|nr:hypothetical protein SCHPADRAFT_943520 [Schizopora paradoxa]